MASGDVSARVVHRTARLAAELAAMPRRGVERGSLEMKKAVISERDKAVGSDGRMSGVGRNGASLNARYDIRAARGGATSIVRATGPWQLIERRTVPHLILSRYAGGSRRSRARLAEVSIINTGRARLRRRGAINIPGIGWRAYARHPGTPGKRPFAKGVNAGEPRALAVMRADAVDAVRRGFTR